MNRLFLGLAVVLMSIGAIGLAIGAMSFAPSYFSRGPAWPWIFGSLVPVGAGLGCLFAAGVLDRLDRLAKLNSELLATVSGDDVA